jgi:single-stranded-DNA-specific exonuclease
MKKINYSGFKFKRWELINKSVKGNTKLISDEIIKILLKNRKIKSIKNKKNFEPTTPEKLSLHELGLKESEINKSLKDYRSQKKERKIIIYGDYDTDGIAGTAILWENLYSLGFDVLPYIPEELRRIWTEFGKY